MMGFGYPLWAYGSDAGRNLATDLLIRRLARTVHPGPVEPPSEVERTGWFRVSPDGLTPWEHEGYTLAECPVRWHPTEARDPGRAAAPGNLLVPGRRS